MRAGAPLVLLSLLVAAACRGSSAGPATAAAVPDAAPVEPASRDALPVVEGFAPEEVRALLKLSPLPSPPADPTNRFADDPRAARLGQWLFFDKRLSAGGTVSCASCHQPERAFSDGKHFGEIEGEAGKVQDRHTPSLFNVAYNRWFFWDGRADSLWAQALRPLEEPREHATSRLAIAHALARDPDLKRAYEETFGARGRGALPGDGEARRRGLRRDGGRGPARGESPLRERRQVARGVRAPPPLARRALR
jgi:cytochrome c peroxidase